MKEQIKELDQILDDFLTKINETFDLNFNKTCEDISHFKFYENFKERMKLHIAKNREELVQSVKKSKWDFYPDNIDLFGFGSFFFAYILMKFLSRNARRAAKMWEKFKASYKEKLSSMEKKLLKKVEDCYNLLETIFKEVSAIYIEINKK